MFKTPHLQHGLHECQLLTVPLHMEIAVLAKAGNGVVSHHHLPAGLGGVERLLQLLLDLGGILYVQPSCKQAGTARHRQKA